MIWSNQLLVWNNFTLHLIILFDIVLCALHYMIFLPYYSVPNLSILSCIFIFYLSSFILLFCAVLYCIVFVLCCITGALPLLIELIANSRDETVREQSLWALGNISADVNDCRDLLLDAGILEPLLWQLGPCIKINIFLHNFNIKIISLLLTFHLSGIVTDEDEEYIFFLSKILEILDVSIVIN